MKYSTQVLQDLRTATNDLNKVNPIIGLFRFSLLGLIFLSWVSLAWLATSYWAFLSFTILAGLFYAFWLICTHDITHHTLTGWIWLEEFLARIISWPMLWPYGCYSQLHFLHHSWNGIDLRDTERVQWTWDEYQRANKLQRFYLRHQWFIDIFVLGGIGLTIKTIANAVRFQSIKSLLRRQLYLDIVGMCLIHSILLAIAISQGLTIKYFIFWLILERIIGIVIQTRDHLEHYGLWGNADLYQLTQLYASRNLKVIPLVGWLMGGLNYHAIHHAFPNIPFYNPREAFQRIQALQEKYNLPPMTLDQGYWQTTIALSRQPSLISEIIENEVTGRNKMLLIP